MYKAIVYLDAEFREGNTTKTVEERFLVHLASAHPDQDYDAALGEVQERLHITKDSEAVVVSWDEEEMFSVAVTPETVMLHSMYRRPAGPYPGEVEFHSFGLTLSAEE